MIPTANVEAEKSVLGAVMLRNDALDLVANLQPEDFYDPKNKDVFAATRALASDRRPIDPVTLEDQLTRAGKLQAIGGITYITDLLAAVPTADNIEAYAEIVRDAAVMRQMADAAARVADRIRRGLCSRDEALAEFQRVAGDVIDRTSRQDCYHSVADLSRELWRDLEDRLSSDKPRGIATGFFGLDAVLASGGIRVGVLTVIGGWSSTGKSTVARAMAAEISGRGQDGVHTLTLEDDAMEVMEGQWAADARIDTRVLGNPQNGMTRGQMSALAGVASRYQQSRRWGIEDQPTMTVQQIAASVRRRKAELGTRVVIVDYLQLIRSRGPDKRQAVDNALDELFALAREERVAVVVLSQLTRPKDEVARAPRWTDLKESGGIYEKAATVLLVHREDPSDKKPEGVAGIIVAKNKRGERNKWVPLHWDAPHATYRNPTVERDYDRGGGA